MRTATWIGLLVLVACGSAYLTWRLTRPVVAPSPYQAVGTVKDIMEGIVDPASDVLFEAVAFTSTAAGDAEHVPQTDEEWARVEHNALMLAEAANLLKMPGRPIARPDQANSKSGEGSPELTPAEIQVKVDADRAKWNSHATALMEKAREAIDQTRQRNVRALFDIGADLDQVCENCHLEYWYPNAPAGVGSR